VLSALKPKRLPSKRRALNDADELPVNGLSREYVALSATVDEPTFGQLGGLDDDAITL
jgi:hypothetical protein